MTAESTELVDRLHALAADIAGWRAQAETLKAAARAPEAGSDDKLLLRVEEVSGSIYGGIAAFDALLGDIDRKSHAAASQIVVVGDALRLLLMEITELGTELYALRSAPALAATADISGEPGIGDAPGAEEAAAK